MNTYSIGSTVRLYATFRQTSDNTLANPDRVFFVISPYTANMPNSSGTFEYGVGSEVVRDGTGTYHMDFLPPALEQVYKYTAYSLGNIYASCDDEEFWVR